MTDERFENGYIRCPKGPGTTRPHTWKWKPGRRERGNRNRDRDACAACGMTRAQVYGLPEPTVCAGQWVRPRGRRNLPVPGVLAGTRRGFCEKLGPDGPQRKALIRLPAEYGWPFPREVWLFVYLLERAPTPRFVEVKP